LKPHLFALALLATSPVATPAASEGLTQLETWQADPTVVLDAAEVMLGDFKWIARPVIVFADSPLDPAFATQLEYFSDRMADVTERDIVLITDTNTDVPSDLRLELRPRGFMMVLMGKDGTVKLRKPFPWNMRELGRAIDKMPIRQREIVERRAASE